MNTDYKSVQEEAVERKKSDSPFMQFIKYAIVGVMNTLLTLVVIYICKAFLMINPYVSNAIGYLLGLINSFLWNRTWVFAAGEGKIQRQAVKFFVGFAICYAIQFFIVWMLNQSSFGKIELIVLGFTFSGYGIATLIGNVAYTLCNFAFNRLVAFK